MPLAKFLYLAPDGVILSWCASTETLANLQQPALQQDPNVWTELVNGVDLTQFIKPVWLSNAVQEGATQAEIDADFVAYKDKLATQIDADADKAFFTDIFFKNDYVELAHLIKGQEGLAYHNDLIKLPTDAKEYPIANKASGVIKSYPIIEGEAATREISVADMVNAIRPLSLTQWDVIRDIEKQRSPKKDAVQAAATRAAADVVYAAWQTYLATVVATYG
jgi:hypothetical protein